MASKMNSTSFESSARHQVENLAVLNQGSLDIKFSSSFFNLFVFLVFICFCVLFGFTFRWLPLTLDVNCCK